MKSFILALLSCLSIFISQTSRAESCSEFLTSYGTSISSLIARSQIRKALSIARYAYTSDTSRTREDASVWLKYKNGRNIDPRIVDLTQRNLDEVWVWAQENDSETGAPWHPNKYEENVISLRKGDTVKFGDKSFKLGKFLGSGNATHIYALADNPKMVIRIPFIVRDLAIRAFVVGLPTEVHYGASHYKRIFEFNELTYRALLKYRDDVTAGDNFRYLLMPRVYGKMTGLDFLNTIAIKLTGHSVFPNEHLDWKLDQLSQALTAHEKIILNRLVDLLRKTDEIMEREGYISIRSKNTRNFLLNPADQWEAIDAE